MNSAERIKWLEKSYANLNKVFKLKAPDDVTIITELTKKGKREGGYCIYDCITKDKEKDSEMTHVISVNLHMFKVPVRALDVLLHEMIHASGIKGHGREFACKANKIGLLPPYKSTIASDYLKKKLRKIVKEIGAMPEGNAIEFGSGAKQASRLRKWVCPCGVIARVASDSFQAECLKCADVFGKVD
jgi:hypothetical protein